MNQILITKNKHISYEDYLYNSKLLTKKMKTKKTYYFIFFFSLIICIIILFYFLYSYFLKLYEYRKTNIIKEKYNTTSLYTKNSNYDSIKLSDEISIIGLITIPKINISYPILSNSNENLLKISVCRFSGPLPNKIGNLCIAGHNYNNTLMFSQLSELTIGDSIYISDLNNTELEYLIYSKKNVKENDISCTQNSYTSEVTLLTCKKHNNKERIVIKAKKRE